jgi:hypothetical protein
MGHALPSVAAARVAQIEPLGFCRQWRGRGECDRHRCECGQSHEHERQHHARHGERQSNRERCVAAHGDALPASHARNLRSAISASRDVRACAIDAARSIGPPQNGRDGETAAYRHGRDPRAGYPEPVPSKLGGECRGGHLKAVDHERAPRRHKDPFETALSAKSISAVANARHVKPHGMAVRNWTIRSTICRAIFSLAVLELGTNGPITGVVRVWAFILSPPTAAGE